MRGKAKRDGRPAIKRMKTFTANVGLFRPTPLRQLCRLKLTSYATYRRRRLM